MKQDAEITGENIILQGTGPLSCDELRQLYLDRTVLQRDILARMGNARPAVLAKRLRALNLKASDRVSDAEFKEMYADKKVTLADMARICGYHATASVSSRANELGLTPRNKVMKASKNEQPKKVERDEIQCPQGVAGAPYWTEALDEMVWAARHNHAMLSALAATLKQPITRVQQRHHQLIAASGIKVW